MTLKRILPIAVIALTLSAQVATAQGAITETDAVAAGTVRYTPAGVMIAGTSLQVGPRLDQTRAGIAVAHESTAVAFALAPQPSISRKRGVPQMIIGGAAILGGAIVGGDAGGLVSLAGLGYGLYGLYLYLQ